ncbi:MAG: hypothetical protein LBP64_10710, partial [Tannerella sp.]|nr:hypothetical protein [Tannerella sp.]
KETERSCLDVSDDLKENDDIRRALAMCEEGAFTAAELEAYDKYLDIIRTEKSLLAESRAEGEAKGLAKGLLKGRAEGMAEGEAKGRAEGEAKGRTESLIAVVRNCKRNGLSAEQIREITGLDNARIMEILRSDGEE